MDFPKEDYCTCKNSSSITTGFEDEVIGMFVLNVVRN